MPKRATKHGPTDEKRAAVMALKSHGVPDDEIAVYLGCSLPTLYRYYQVDLDTAAADINRQVGEFLSRAATGAVLKDPDTNANFSDCVRAAMFWAKTRMRWRETTHLDLSAGEQQGPVQAIKLEVVGAANDSGNTASS